MKALISDRKMVGRLLGLDCGMLLENNGHESRIEKTGLRLVGDEVVYPGTRFTKIGSNQTSAGNQPVFMNEGCWFEYLGIIRSLDGDLVVFRQQPNDMGGKYFPCYWYYHGKDYGSFLWFTQACAGRITHLTHCEYECD